MTRGPLANALCHYPILSPHNEEPGNCPHFTEGKAEPQRGLDSILQSAQILRMGLGFELRPRQAQVSVSLESTLSLTAAPLLTF